MLEAVSVKEAWDNLAQCYHQVRGKQAHPTREGLNQEFVERVELYRCRPPARIWLPILVHLVVVNNDIMVEVYIEMVVQGIKGGRSGGASGMIAEDLKGWRK